MDSHAYQSVSETHGVQRERNRETAHGNENANENANAQRQDACLTCQGGTAEDDVLVESLTPPESTVSYMSLPHKRQLAILMFARLAEPLAASSIQSYIYFQLQSFNPEASAATISAQAGAIFSSKMAAQSCTALLWGRLADAEYGGRKPVLALGLLVSMGALLGYGFSRSFVAALVWQVVDGAMNSSVSMVRCVTAELNPQKKHRARALTLLPLFANLGTLIGPLIGGFLASPATQSAGSSIISDYPYAAPNIITAAVQGAAAFAVIFGLNETSSTARKRGKSFPRSFWKTVKAWACREPVSQQERDERIPILHDHSPSTQSLTKPTSIPSFHQMWTRNVISTLFAQFIIAGHLGTFSSLWAIFLSTPPALPSHEASPAPSKPDTDPHSVIHTSSPALAGGLGMDPRGVGITISLLGAFGVLLQVIIYPTLNDRLGTIPLWRTGLFIFPLAYVLAPLCASPSLWNHQHQSPNSSPPPPLSHPTVLLLVLTTLLLFVTGRTFVVPATTLLINDCTRHPSVRATIHTMGTLVSNLGRTVFPAVALPIFGYGLSVGVGGLAFWFLAGVATAAGVVGMMVVDGDAGG